MWNNRKDKIIKSEIVFPTWLAMLKKLFDTILM